MSVFYFYNVQVLPVAKGSKSIGAEGYVRLFRELGTRVAALRRRRTLHQFGYRLTPMFSMSPFEVSFKPSYIFGRFVKYDSPDAIRDLYTNDVTVKVAPGHSAHRYEIAFQFDPDIHIMAVEKARLGAPKNAETFLEFLLSPVVDELYPDHGLTVTLLTSAEDLEAIMKSAKGFRRIDLQITYSNSDATIRGYIKEIESELRSNRIANVEHAERSDPKGFLSKPTKFCSALLALASKYGQATVRFLSSNDRVETYVSEDNPIKERVHKYATETEEDYERRLFDATRRANDKATSRRVLKK